MFARGNRGRGGHVQASTAGRTGSPDQGGWCMRRFIGVAIAVLVVAGAIVGILSSGRSDGAAPKSGGGSSASSATDGASTVARDAAGGELGKVTANATGAGTTAPAPSAPALPSLPSQVVQHARVDLRIRGRVLDARVRAARDAGGRGRTRAAPAGAAGPPRAPAARRAGAPPGRAPAGRPPPAGVRG